MPGQDTYVALPDGKYVHIPAGATPDQLAALRTKLGGKAAPSPFNNTNSSIGPSPIFGGSVGPRPSQGPVIDTIDKAREWLETKATTGSQAKAGEFMESAPLGALRMARGGAELGGHPWQGVKDIVGGGMQAATMPGMVMAPEGAGAAAELIPSTARAGRKFEEVMGAAKDVPLNAEEATKAAMRGKEMFQHGSPSLPRILRAFTNRMADPEAAPMNYKEARDFYSNARLSMTEYLRNNPTMWRQVTVFKNALGEALQEAATAAGKGSEYKSAMTEYRRAKTLQKLAGAAASLGIKMGGLGAAASFLKSATGSQ